MSQLDFHISTTTIKTPPRQSNKAIPVIGKFKASYKLWHGYLTHLPKLTRYTLGAKIDNLFTDSLELALYAQYSERERKKNTIEQLSVKFDSLKFFLQLLWEVDALEDNKYLALSHHLAGIGKMIGGWKKYL